MQTISKSDPLLKDVERLRNLLLALGQRRSLRDPIVSICEETQLTPPQTHALLWLGYEPLAMGELARRLGITEKTVTGVVDRLERKDFLRRERDRTDRRIIHVRITRKGSAVYQRLDRHILAGMHRLLSMLDRADRRDLFRVLDKLLRKLDPPAQKGAS